MRILIDLNGRYTWQIVCYSAPLHLNSAPLHLGGSSSLDSAMSRKVSTMRVKWCWGPSARALVVALTLGRLCEAEALPTVTRTSPSRALAGLLRAANFKGGREASSRFTKLDAVDAYEAQEAKKLSKKGYELALHVSIRAFAREFLLREVPTQNLCTRTGPFFRASALSAISADPFLIVPPFPIGKCRPDSVREPNSWPIECAHDQSTASDRFAGLPALDTLAVISSRAAMAAIFLSALSPSTSRTLAVLFVHFVYAEATICPHCKDTILPAAHAASACPLVTELNNNAAIFTNKKLGSSPTVVHSLTHELAMQFTRPVIDAIVGLACAPVHGLSVDFTDATYTQSNAVVKAAVYGHCSFAEASAVLSERLDAATDPLVVEKIRGAMDTLKSASESAVNTATGTFMFIWAKVSNVISKRMDFTFKLEAAGKAKATSHTATLVRPETEAEFYEMSHLFVMTVIALGLASATIVMKFMDDVVFATIRMKESFKLAHELLILYLREMDFDPARSLHMGNVFRRGGQDTLLSEARRNAAASFRTCGGTPQLEGATKQDTKNPKPDIKPNGKFDGTSKKPCPDFNAGRPCKKLKPDGTCVFAHRCNQFVSDKGPGGYCFGAHARCTGCDYDAGKKLRAPAA